MLTEPAGGTFVSGAARLAGTSYPGARVSVVDAAERKVCAGVARIDGTWACTPDTPLPLAGLPSADAHAGRPVGAVVFDLDGLLIDSEPFWRRAEIEVFARVGVHLTEQDTRQTMGLRIDDAVDHWYRRRPWEGMAPVEVERAVTSRVAELIEGEGVPMPGALAVIDLYRDRSIPMAVCSGSYAMVIEAAMDKLGITASMSAWLAC